MKKKMKMRERVKKPIGLIALGVMGLAIPAMAQDKKPNILVIMGDDVGITNISAYSRGLMGYQTPNLDRIAEEGALFTDYYGEQSCTAGRATFITGQSPFRVGLTKVGMPGAKQGISDKDPTLAQLLKPLGYTSGQFGKNHLGDRNEYLPTVHGFDEYAGVLYHLNALDFLCQRTVLLYFGEHLARSIAKAVVGIVTETTQLDPLFSDQAGQCRTVFSVVFRHHDRIFSFCRCRDYGLVRLAQSIPEFFVYAQ